jgi:hypothetical protein
VGSGVSPDMGEDSQPPGARAEFAHPLWLVAGLVLMAAALGLAVLAARPPAPKPATAPASEFSAARVVERLERLLGDEVPHPTSSEANVQVRERIRDELTAMGFQVETQTKFACRRAWVVCGEVTNIMSRLPGTVDGPAVLLTAHYDSVPSGPGAGDDMAGVATILEVARLLRAEPPARNPIVFLFSDGEEPGLLGVEAFMTDHPWADDVGVVVNLEANGTHGQSILFQTTGDNAWLIDTFASRAPRPVASSVYDAIYAFLPFNTDLTVYNEAGLPGLNFAFIEEHPHYHTRLDSLANLDPGSLQHHGDNALAATQAFASLDLTKQPAGRSVFQDLLPGVVVRWPEPWTIWLALAAVLLWIGITAIEIRRGGLSWRGLAWGLTVPPVAIVGATLLGLALATGVMELTHAALPWYAHPLAMRVAVGTGALLCVGLAATFVAPRAGFRGLFLGTWLWWAALSLLMAIVVAGISPLLLLPTLFAGLVAAVGTASPLSTMGRTREFVALAGLFGANWFWLSFVRGSDYSSLGPDLGPFVGFAVGLGGSTLAPFFALPPAFGRWRRWALAGAALLVVVATGVALRVPASSESRPLRLNLLHVEDRQSNQALWALDGAPLPGNGGASGLNDLLRAAPFSDQWALALPWSSQQYRVAPAMSTTPGPVVTLKSDEHSGAERVVRLELRSPSGSNRMSLYVPIAAGLRRIDVAGTPYSFEEPFVEDGHHWFRCIGEACDGLMLELLMQPETDDPVTLIAVDIASGLPRGGEALIAARPPTAAPSGDGDSTLVVDRMVLEGS